MNEQYYICEWKIRFTKQFRLLIKNQTDLGYKLAIKDGPRQNNDGLWVYSFVLGVQSEDQLTRFIDLVGSKLEMVDWQATSKEDYDNEDDFVESWQKLAGNQRGAFIDWLIMMEARNEVVIDSHNEESNSLFFSCDWIMQPLTLTDFARTEHVCEILDVLLYVFGYDMNEQGCRVHKLAVRVPSEQILDQFVSNVGAKVKLANWQPISRDDFYRGQKVGGFYTINDFIKSHIKHAEINATKKC